jgi:hypothetical protein
MVIACEPDACAERPQGNQATEQARGRDMACEPHTSDPLPPHTRMAPTPFPIPAPLSAAGSRRDLPVPPPHPPRGARWVATTHPGHPNVPPIRLSAIQRPQPSNGHWMAIGSQRGAARTHVSEQLQSHGPLCTGPATTRALPPRQPRTVSAPPARAAQAARVSRAARIPRLQKPRAAPPRPPRPRSLSLPLRRRSGPYARPRAAPSQPRAPAAPPPARPTPAQAPRVAGHRRGREAGRLSGRRAGGRGAPPTAALGAPPPPPTLLPTTHPTVLSLRGKARAVAGGRDAPRAPRAAL